MKTSNLLSILILAKIFSVKLTLLMVSLLIVSEISFKKEDFSKLPEVYHLGMNPVFLVSLQISWMLSTAF